MSLKKVTISSDDLEKLGFPSRTAKEIIQNSKKIAVELFNNKIASLSKNNSGVVKYPCSPFTNPKVNVAPRNIVELLLGFSLADTSAKERNQNE